MVVAFLCLSGCAAHRSPSPNLPLTSHIQVREFDVAGARVESFHDPVAPFGKQAAEEVAKELRAYGLNAEAIGRDAPATADVVVEGRVTEIDGGSRVTRWRRHGIGATPDLTRFGVTGRVTRGERTLGEFASSDVRRSAYDLEDRHDMLSENVEIVADEVAEAIASGNYGTRN